MEPIAIMPHERDAEQPASTWRCLRSGRPTSSWATKNELGSECQRTCWALENLHTRSTTQADWLHAPSQLGLGKFEVVDDCLIKLGMIEIDIVERQVFALEEQIEPIWTISANCVFNERCDLPELLHRQCYVVSLHLARWVKLRVSESHSNSSRRLRGGGSSRCVGILITDDGEVNIDL